MVWQECGVCHSVYTQLVDLGGVDIAMSILEYLINKERHEVRVCRTTKDRYFGEEIHEHHTEKVYMDIMDIDHSDRDDVHPHKTTKTTYIFEPDEDWDLSRHDFPFIYD